MNHVPTAEHKRAHNEAFATTFSLDVLRDRLPLPFPVTDDVAVSPKRRYRSAYRYLGCDDLADPVRLRQLSDFEVALRVVDFGTLRDLLAAHYVRSAKGQAPFDPVSMLLCLCLRRELDVSWHALARLLAGPHGAEWRRHFGFRDGDTPSTSGLRYFQNAVGEATFLDLSAQFVDLLRKANLAPERSTFPDDPPGRGVTIVHDGMLHHARSRMRCARVCDTCYQPAPRPCPARDTEGHGCACDSPECADHCQLATPRDPDARLIHYSGRNKHADRKADVPRRGRNVYGYVSSAVRLVDDRFACAWTVASTVHPANTVESGPFLDHLARLGTRFPDLSIGEVLADAGVGHHDCLKAVFDLGALRMIDIRATDNDGDPAVQRRRGYDADGRPLCPHGRPLVANGHDYRRQRTKWCCRKTCERTAHPPECPFRHAGKFGYVLNLGFAFPDASARLARDVPYHSLRWKKRYGRRNLSESRNGTLERLGLKHLPCHGLSRSFKEIATADFLDNLTTLGRLVREATTLVARTTIA
jgi:hypothetical protein